MAAFALSELLPNKWYLTRYLLVGFADSFEAPYRSCTRRSCSSICSHCCTSLSEIWFGRRHLAMGTYKSALANAWDADDFKNFYACAILQGLSFLGLYLLYFPPAHPYNMDPKQVIKHIDYVGKYSIRPKQFQKTDFDNQPTGMLLFPLGAIPVLMGIVWTNVYPSDDPHVVASLVIGFFFLVLFALWETYSKTEHPLTPTYMFVSSHGRDLTAPCIALAVVNMFYYSSSILWPTMISVFYTNSGTDWKYGIVLSTVYV